MIKQHRFNILTKAMITITVIYETVIYVILKDNRYGGICRDIFICDFCDKSYRFFVLMTVPVIIGFLLYMWRSELYFCRTKIYSYRIKQIEKRKQRQELVKSVKQFFVSFLEQSKKTVNADNLFYLKQILLNEQKNPVFLNSFRQFCSTNEVDIMNAIEILNRMIDEQYDQQNSWFAD
ncbi:MAG: hypothetical protein NC548_64200 [Lachnospiraceae bacterium]|nr:hypothetical protein [Lachnospiraceae bacterium]